jgi:hypothetical protein
MKNKRLLIILSSAATLLTVPYFAMQFTDEVDWGIMDFTIMGILLFGTGFICEFIMRMVKSTQIRIILCGAILLIFFLIWAELAVGIFGSPFAGS